MRRAVHKPELRKVKLYHQKGGNRKRSFWGTIFKKDDITQPIGQPMADGNIMVKTEADLDFAVNDRIYLGNEENSLLVEWIDREVETDNNNTLRGSIHYITTMLIK